MSTRLSALAALVQVAMQSVLCEEKQADFDMYIYLLVRCILGKMKIDGIGQTSDVWEGKGG
jgi:hypothetical protein